MNILYILQYSSNISTLQGRFDQMIRRGVSTKERKKPPLPRERRQSLSKKPRRVCRPQAANKVQSVFCGGVYVAKNTSRSASVEFVRFQRTNYARGRLQAFDCQKRVYPFLTVKGIKRRPGRSGRPRRPRTGASCAASAGASWSFYSASLRPMAWQAASTSSSGASQQVMLSHTRL